MEWTKLDLQCLWKSWNLEEQHEETHGSSH